MQNNHDKNHMNDLNDEDMFLDSEKFCNKKTIYIIIIVLFATLIGGYYIYNSYKNNSIEEVIIISADDDDDDNKEQPSDPGGMVVSNMDKDIYDTIDKTSKKNKEEIEVLLPPAEEPVDKKEAVTPKKEEQAPEAKPITVSENKAVIKDEDYIKPIAQTKAKKKNKFVKKTESFYRVQIASFKSKKDAQKQWDLLSKRYKKLLAPHQHYIVSKDIEGKGIFQRLQVGPFENERAARKACSNFKDAGLNCFIIKP